MESEVATTAEQNIGEIVGFHLLSLQLCIGAYPAANQSQEQWSSTRLLNSQSMRNVDQPYHPIVSYHIDELVIHWINDACGCPKLVVLTLRFWGRRGQEFE